ncbi:hypothetical protein Acsp06_17860 [Actinomycetospora sp. NBRC 106375]|uniref:hypothetical protein n=1 Tax=Actinomycetospora sp. NBRC 106375 TaxID=3032207 RepID=UPI0024A46F1C|nr:hypothetical protein [Actinomycetospora sp. NBRC 106375]GLZ45601.1 hypothetical protein Acsp06_17860 [Actinomycetospora sp. NBRC 106375]
MTDHRDDEPRDWDTGPRDWDTGPRDWDTGPQDRDTGSRDRETGPREYETGAGDGETGPRGYATGSRSPSRYVPPPRPRPRRWVTALGVLTVFVLGVAGGVVADRYLAVGCPTCAPPAGEGVPLVGFLESSSDGLLAVRTPDGRLVPVRTSVATRLVDQAPRPGLVSTLPRGTRVSVLGVPDADGTLTAQTVGVPG